MALEAVVFQQDLFGGRDLHNQLLSGDNYDQSWRYDYYFGFDQPLDDCYYYSYNPLGSQTEASFDLQEDHHQFAPDQQLSELQIQSSYCSSTSNASNNEQQVAHELESPGVDRAKRRRSRSKKNKEEIENQRMTHIAVERNRRKQMNEYLSVLRSLMPDSYVQRGDQASIIGGAINFVRELEHRLHLLRASAGEANAEDNPDASPFSESLKFPQFTMSKENPAVADIEVSVAESHASIKIRSRKRPKQLLKVVSGLHTLRLTVLHLNVSTFDQTVLYCFTVKMEDDCRLTSVNDVASAVYQLLIKIREDAISR